MPAGLPAPEAALGWLPAAGCLERLSPPKPPALPPLPPCNLPSLQAGRATSGGAAGLDRGGAGTGAGAAGRPCRPRWRGTAEPGAAAGGRVRGAGRRGRACLRHLPGAGLCDTLGARHRAARCQGSANQQPCSSARPSSHPSYAPPIALPCLSRRPSLPGLSRWMRPAGTRPP